MFVVANPSVLTGYEHRGWPVAYVSVIDAKGRYLPGALSALLNNFRVCVDLS